ncbi:MAG: T9SS type A sorting domain-containing protein, partial [Bacteroidota bacterium]
SWFAAASGGTSLGTGTSFTTPIITGTTTYYAETTAGACTSARSAVVATINTIPTVTSTTPASSCGTGSVTLAATASAGTLNWYAASSGGSSLGTGTTYNTPSISSPTTYYVETSDGTCTSPRSAVVATINALPNVTVNADGAICIGSSFGLTAGGANSYSWNNGLGLGINKTVSPTVTTTYTVTGTDINGCQNTAAVTVTVNTLPTVDAGLDAAICENGSITLSGSGANSYSWDNSVTDGAAFNPGATATYTVTGTDLNGCQNTDQVTITVNPLPLVDAGSDAAICENGMITLAGSGANSYSWDNSVTDGVSFSAAVSTTYTVTGTDLNGCQNTDQVTITVNTLPLVDAGSDATVCGNTLITLSGSGANSYSWDNGAADGVAFAALATTTYTVTGTDINGCVNTDLVTVTVNALPIVDAGADISLCTATSVALNGSGANSYSWDNGVTDGIAFNPIATATYTVTGTDLNGCQNTDQVIVSVNTLPTVDAGLDITVCENGIVTLAGSGAVSYSWDNGVTDDVAFTALTTTTYTVTGTDINGCVNTDQVTVTVNTLPLVDAGSDAAICENGTLTLNGAGADSYSWDNGVTDGVMFNPAATATYTVTGTDLNGCVNTDQVTITVNMLPAVDAGGDLAVCENGPVTLSGAGAGSYTWDNGVTDGDPFTPLITATYTVTGTDGNGCQNTDMVTVTVNALPAVGAGSDITVCENGTVILSGSGADSYSWDNGVTNGVSFNPTSTNTYTVTGTDLNGCQNTDQITVSVNALPTVNTTSPIEICKAEELTLTASSTASIIKWFDQPLGGNLLGEGSSLVISDIQSNGTVYVESFENGCSSARVQVDILVNDKPVIAVSSTNSDCGANNGTASASISQGTAPYFYYWSEGTQNQFNISNLPTGAYYFNVEDAKGCKAMAVTEVNPSAIQMNPVVVNPSCFGTQSGSITLNISGVTESIHYLWNTGHQTSGISGLAAGTYEVTVTTESGCVLSSSFVLTQPAAIENTLVETAPSCGDNDGQISVQNTTGGNGPYLYSWSNGQFGLNNNNLTYGAYTLTTTDQGGCQVHNTVLLPELNAPIVEGIVTQTACNGSTGAVDLDITPVNGDQVASIVWSNGATTEDVSGLAAGNYVSFITSVNNCVAVNAWSINIVQPNTQEICIVTVDSVTTTNLVVWEKAQLNGISHYNIYRESNQIDDYQLIDTVQFDNLSVFNDVVASPLARSWRYKIAAVDMCGVEGPLSSHHKTLHLNTFDLGGSGVQITWDGYEGTAFSSYTLWRYTDEFGWEDIATLGTSALTYTDPTSFQTPGLDYMVEISLDVPCTATVWRAQDFNRSRSNKERGLFRPGEGTGDYSNNEIMEFEDGNISLNVYPNPFSDNVTLNLAGTHSMNIQLFDIHGKLILENVYFEGENTVNLSKLEDGVYFIRTMINNESRTIKITKN